MSALGVQLNIQLNVRTKLKIKAVTQVTQSVCEVADIRHFPSEPTEQTCSTDVSFYINRDFND